MAWARRSFSSLREKPPAPAGDEGALPDRDSHRRAALCNGNHLRDGLCSRSLVEAHLRHMTDSGRSLGRQISELLELMRQYGPEDVAGTIEKAAAVPEISASRRPSSCSPIWSWIPPGPSSADSSTRVCRRSPASRCVAGGHPRAVAQR
jgi:hypothetical protein